MSETYSSRVTTKIYLKYIYAVGILFCHKKAGTQTDICTPMFIAALFTIVKRWKQPKCPLMDECISKMCYIRTMEYYIQP